MGWNRGRQRPEHDSAPIGREAVGGDALPDPARGLISLAAVLAGLLFGIVAPAAGAAEVYPTKAIRVIISWPAGGPTDTVSRVLMTRLSSRMGVPIVIDNRPGGNGIIGFAAAAKAPADGYSLLIADIGPSTVLPAMRTDLPYDTLRDFVPVSLMVTASNVLFVREGLPIRSVPELIVYAKARPGELTYGSVGQGSSFHLATELLKAKAGIDMRHIPYKGGPPLIADFTSGRIDVSFLNITNAYQAIKQGKVRPLAVSTRERSALLPDLPSISEAIPNFDVSTWFGLLSPAGTPREIVDRLQKEIAAVVSAPDIAEQLRNLGQQPVGSTPEQYAARLRSDLAVWGEVVRDANIKASD